MRNFLLCLLFISVFSLGFISCAKRQILDQEVDVEEDSSYQDFGKKAEDIPEPNIRDKEFRKNENLKTIYFIYDKSVLTKEARKTLEKNAEWLKHHKGFHLLVEGHADERGTIEYNLALGQERASAVRSYLVFLGIRASRIGTISYGEEKPNILENTEEAWRHNRRAELLYFE